MIGIDPEGPARKPTRQMSAPRLTVTRLLVAGGGLAVAAVITWIGLMLIQFDGYHWPDASLVPADGRRHAVQLRDEGTALLWTYDSLVTPTCTVVDTATGTALPLSTSDLAYRREGGSAGDWVGTATFQPGSRFVEVSCARLSRRSSVELVAVETAPNVPPTLATFGPFLAIPLVLSLAGLVAVAGALATCAVCSVWPRGHHRGVPGAPGTPQTPRSAAASDAMVAGPCSPLLVSFAVREQPGEHEE